MHKVNKFNGISGGSIVLYETKYFLDRKRQVKEKENRMIKEFIIGLVILAYVIPFLYIFIADIADVVKRAANLFSLKLKPALIVISKTFID